MRTRARVAALSVIAIFGVGCGKPVTTTVRPLSTTTTVKTVSAPRPVPLVLETLAPPRRPAVALVVRSGTRDNMIAGRLYTADWATKGATPVEQAPDPVPWPAATTIAGGDDPTIALGTSFMPDFVVVKVFTQVEPGPRIPIGLPIVSFGCNRFTAPRCTVERPSSGIRLLHLDQTVYSGTYLVVFAQWHLPGRQRVAGSPSDTATGSWLFRVHHTRATAPSP
jgi:hypothetical protein